MKIKIITMTVLIIGFIFTGAVFADEWYYVTGTPGSPEQRSEPAQRDRSAGAIASNNLDENWHSILGTPGSPEQRSDFGDTRADRSSETMAATSNFDESYMNLGTPGSPEQQPGFSG
jgi:hypothetical protein